MMGIVYFLMINSFFSHSLNSDPCELLDGTYAVVFDQSEVKNSEIKFIVKGDQVTIVDFRGRVPSLVTRLNEDQIEVEPIVPLPTRPTKIEKALNSLGTPFYLLTDCDGETINFKYMRNLHITMGTGKLVLVD